MKNSFMDWIQSIQKGLKKNFHQTTPQQDHRNLIWLNFRLSSTAIGLLNRHDFDVLGACGWFFNSREMRWCPDLLRLPRHYCLSLFLEVKQNHQNHFFLRFFFLHPCFVHRFSVPFRSRRFWIPRRNLIMASFQVIAIVTHKWPWL